MDMQMSGVGVGNPYPVMEFLRILAGPKPSGIKLVSMATTNIGALSVTFYDGTSSENTIATFVSPSALTANQWAHLDFTASTSGSGSFVLRVGGTVILSSTGVGISGPYPVPDTITPFRWQGFGPPGIAIDNLIIYDGQVNGDGFVSPTLYPQQRITTVIATADVTGGAWAPLLTAAQLSSDAVNPTRFNTPMSDYDYATPNTANALQLFQMGTVVCYGRINAIALNLATKAVPPISSLPVVSAVVREVSAIETLGVLTTLNLFPSGIGGLVRGYWILQAIAAFSLQTGGNWQATTLGTIEFGMISDPASLPERVSAIFLEVLTDTSGLPFTCGGASNYSY